MTFKSMGIKEKPKKEDFKVLLLDYYERTVGTPEEQPYYELAVYSYPGEQVLLEQYINGGSDSEEVRKYLVSKDIVTETMKVIQEEKMDRWKEMTCLSGLCGKLYVCRFRQDDSYTRVSSDSMPEFGTGSFDRVRKTMSSYIAEKNRI